MMNKGANKKTNRRANRRTVVTSIMLVVLMVLVSTIPACATVDGEQPTGVVERNAPIDMETLKNPGDDVDVAGFILDWIPRFEPEIKYDEGDNVSELELFTTQKLKPTYKNMFRSLAVYHYTIKHYKEGKIKLSQLLLIMHKYSEEALIDFGIINSALVPKGAEEEAKKLAELSFDISALLGDMYTTTAKLVDREVDDVYFWSAVSKYDIKYKEAVKKYGDLVEPMKKFIEKYDVKDIQTIEQ